MSRNSSGYLFILILIILSIVFPAAARSFAAKSPDLEDNADNADNKQSALTKQLDKELPVLLDKAKIPGISFALIESGEIVYNSVFGFKNTRKPSKADENTIFEAASLTKPVAAWITLKLVDQGKLELDKPLYNYLEYTPIKHDVRYKSITARMVLTHSSGFPNWRRQNKDNLLDIKFTPGSKFSYSGEGYVYLQAVLESITGKNLEDLAQELVFKPFGMTHSSLLLTELEDAALGHNRHVQPRQKMTYEEPNAAYSLHSNAGDYARFLIAMTSGRGLSAQSAALLTTTQIAVKDSFPTIRWCAGMGLENDSDDSFLWHWGDNKNFKCFAMISKNSRNGFVYFTNGVNGMTILDTLIGMVTGKTLNLVKYLEYPQFNAKSNLSN